MKIIKTSVLTILFFFGLSIFAQTANPDVVYLTPEQSARFVDLQKDINLAQAQLEAAVNAQALAVMGFREEQSAPTKEYGQLLRFGNGQFGFVKKKPETKDKK